MKNLGDFVDEEIYPPSKSAGGINAYCMGGCNVVGYQPGYCICVNKIIAMERDGTLKGSSDQCEKAIRDSACPALVMRNEELSAGRAIYFVNRDKFRAHMAAKGDVSFTAVDRPSVKSVARTIPPPPLDRSIVKPLTPPPPLKNPGTRMPPPPPPMPDMSQGYAAAINAALREEADKPAAPKSKPITQAPEPKPEPVKQEPAPKAEKPKVQPEKESVIKPGMTLLEIARARQNRAAA